MGNVLVREETLTEIADAIREKTGFSDKYKPPQMPNAIRNISTSADDGPSEEDPIRFYGYEGKLLYSYSIEEMKALTELPRLPEVEGLICQGWNWSLENLQALNREMDVGAIFITDDGATRIYVSLNEDTLHPCMGIYQRVANCMKIDWGDGSQPESSAVINERIWFEHQYETPGNYVIRLVPEEGADVLIYGGIGGTNLFQKNTNEDRTNISYSNTIEKIEIGKGITYFGEYALMGRNLKYVTIPNEKIDLRAAFESAKNLKYIAIPNTVITIWGDFCNGGTCLEKVCFPEGLKNIYSDVFRDCISLKTVCLPEQLSGLGSAWFLGCDNLRRISFPDNLKTIPTSALSGCDRLESIWVGTNTKEISSQAFYNCKCLKELQIPEGITKLGYSFLYGNELFREINIPESVVSIDSGAFQYCYGLIEMTIPQNVTSIAGNAFNGCIGIDNYYFYPSTSPTLGADTVFKSIKDTCKIHVPKGCLEAYQTADIWSTFAAYMVEMEE